VIYRNEGKYSQSESLFTKVIQLQRRVNWRPASRYTGCDIRTGGDVLQPGHVWSGRTTVLEVRRRVLGPEHPDTTNVLTVRQNSAQAPEIRRGRGIFPRNSQGSAEQTGCMAAIRNSKCAGRQPYCAS
jgi:hypothetical protein